MSTKNAHAVVASFPATCYAYSMEIDSAIAVKDIIAANPSAARVFEDLGIDYCCGGGDSLEQACRAADRPLNEVIKMLRQPGAAPREEDDLKGWSDAPLAKVIQHIVEKHHAYCRREQERLGALFDKVTQAHAARHPELGRMRSLFNSMIKEMSMHFRKEEDTLFPMILQMESAAAGGAAMAPPAFGTIQNPVSVMLREHDDTGAALKQLRQLSGGYQAPSDACNAYRSLYGGLKDFEADMHQHIYLENYILFPRTLVIERELDALRG